MNNIIVLSGVVEPGLSAIMPSARAAAAAERDGLLAMVRGVDQVRDLATAESAASALRSLKEFTRQIELARADAKAPVLDLGKRIDQLARDLTAELDAEADRLSRALGAWNAEQRRLQEERDRKAREEEQRIWREAQEKERLERERLAKAEAERREKAAAELREIEAKTARARSEAGKAKAAEQAEALRIQHQIEADQRQAEAERDAATRNEAAGKAMVAARIQGNAIEVVKPAGVATRQDVAYEVTDVKALYAALPHLCVLTENKAFLKDHLKRLKDGETVPGVKWWKEAKTHVR